VVRCIRSLLIAVVVVAWAGMAQAVSVYGEFLTPDWGVRATLTVDFDYGDLDLSVSGAEQIAGLPNGGYVGSSTPLSYTHHFKPGVSVDSIEGAWLCVGLVDDAYPLTDLWTPNEYAEIEINGELWTKGSAVFNVLGGSLAIDAFEQDGEFVVTVSSTDSSDFRVAGSLFKVKYNPTPPIPEPTSAAVFGLGAVLVGAVVLRRRRA